MYLNCSEEFRRDYCALWKAMVLLDTPRVEAICRSWGISDANFFASLQLLKPFSPQNNAVHLNATTKAEVYEMQIEAYERVKQLLADSQRVPLELILLGRNLNIVRANNKGMGSPVNRVSIMAWFAARGACAGVPPLLGDEEELLQWYCNRVQYSHLLLGP
jgi:aarF domain-containing kinase